ncbi:MAG TPA: CoA transferase [Xanthobacteraceae bacterium]|nr:CoA transferase [Xanthobacteraceae bacterium]
MLEGIRVIELGTVITAPLTGMMLGDLGADVIKVERPEGDPFRRSHGDDYGPTFVAYNRDKRSIVLDLTIERDRKTLLDLIDGCDVLLDNFRPTVLGKLGLAPEVLRERNPRLIQCSITGFGATGPYSDRPAFDAVGLALSGVASLFVDPQNPEAFGPTISDNVTGMNACCAVLAALVERARTGRGRRLEINMLEATMAFSPDAFTNFTRAGTISDRLTRVATSQSFAFSCADGSLLAIHLSTREKFWRALLDALEAPELGADERFANHLNRTEHYVALRGELALRFSTRARQEWLERLADADVPAAPIWNAAEALDDPQVQALGAVCETRHPVKGAIRSIHCPILVDGRRPRAQMRPPPLLGEQSVEILAEASQSRSHGKG